MGIDPFVNNVFIPYSNSIPIDINEIFQLMLSRNYHFKELQRFISFFFNLRKNGIRSVLWIE